MQHLTGLSSLKSTYAFYRRSAAYLWQILTRRRITRTTGVVQSDYAGSRDWAKFDSLCLVRRDSGLALMSLREIHQRYARIITDAAVSTCSKTLLEVGCGDGLNLALLTGFELRGFDLVPERIARARERVSAQLWVGDATQPQPQAIGIDLVYSVHAVEQMQHGWLAAIRNMRDIAPHVLLIEPFYERKDVHGKLHSTAQGYFKGRLSEVLSVGFELVREYPVEFRDPWNASTAVLLRRM